MRDTEAATVEPHDPKRLRLNAGPLAMLFDVDSLFLRRVTLGNVELLRGIYTAVRDENWGTLKADVEVLKCDIRSEGFHLRLAATYGGASPLFRWDVEVEGDAAGNLRYLAEGTALRTLRTNRTGICILHPAAAAGCPCTVTHPGGGSEESAFPAHIDPNPPFTGISGITHEAAPGVRVVAVMEGEVFETEDQRNWTDASFKTYCRPLSRGFPYTLEKGAQVRQEVRVSVPGAVGEPVIDEVEGEILVDAPLSFRPALPMGVVRCNTEPLSAAELAELRPAALDHLWVKLIGPAREQRDQLENALVDAQRLDCRLRVALALRNARHAQEVAAALAGLRLPRSISWTPLDSLTCTSTAELFGAVRAAWAEHGIPGSLGSGAAGNFAEFNRARPVYEGSTFASCGMCPQVHAFDELSMAETLEMQPIVLEEMRHIAGGLPACAAPVTMLPLFNPVATTAASAELPAEPRMHTPFATAWTLGCLAALSLGGAHCATVHCITGPLGVVPPGGSPSPLLQLYHALGSLAGYDWAVICDGPAGLPCGLAIRQTGHLTVFAANLSFEPRHLHLTPAALESVNSDVLPEGYRSPRCVPPWSLHRVDFEL